MKNAKKIAAVLFAILLFLCVTFSIEYSTTHQIHHCTGHSCSVCFQLHIAEHILSGLKHNSIYLGILLLLFVAYQSVQYSISVVLRCLTLITLKVKLTD